LGSSTDSYVASQILTGQDDCGTSPLPFHVPTFYTLDTSI